MKIQQVPSVERKGWRTKTEWQRHGQEKRKRLTGMGEVDCDALNESQISATYCIFSVQHKSVLSPLSAAEEIDFWEERRDNVEGNFSSNIVPKIFNLQLSGCSNILYVNLHSVCTASTGIFHYTMGKIMFIIKMWVTKLLLFPVVDFLNYPISLQPFVLNRINGWKSSIKVYASLCCKININHHIGRFFENMLRNCWWGK